MIKTRGDKMQFPKSLDDYVKELRGTIMDHPELNHVLLDRDDGENRDFTDSELERSLNQALARINAYPPRTMFNFKNFPSRWHYVLLIDQAIVRLLMMKGILRTRNEMPYQDSGGISIDMRGKGQQYISIAQMFYQTSQQELITFKQTISIDQSWGGVDSPYSRQW